MKKVFAVCEIKEIEVVTDVNFVNGNDNPYRDYYRKELTKYIDCNCKDYLKIETVVNYIKTNDIIGYFTSEELAEDFILNHASDGDYDNTLKIEELYITDWKYSNLAKEGRLD